MSGKLAAEAVAEVGHRHGDPLRAFAFGGGALVRYCDDDHLETDNNAAERALRAVALGRKN